MSSNHSFPCCSSHTEADWSRLRELQAELTGKLKHDSINYLSNQERLDLTRKERYTNIMNVSHSLAESCIAERQDSKFDSIVIETLSMLQQIMRKILIGAIPCSSGVKSNVQDALQRVKLAMEKADDVDATNKSDKSSQSESQISGSQCNSE